MTNLAIGAAVVLALVVVGLAIWLVPRWQVRGWRRAGITEEEKLAELAVQARSAITQAFGGLALIATLAITAYQVNETRRSSEDTLRLAEQGQLSERFSRAVEQLGATNADGSPAIDIRMGALFSLLRIGVDSKENAQPAFLFVATYVRNNYRRPKNLPGHGCDDFQPPRPDVAIALAFVLPAVAEALPEDMGEPPLRGLRGTDLRGLGVDGLVLTRLNLTGIKFRVAQLKDADFSESNLFDATFERACLKGADFRQAVLLSAVLRGANLQDANLQGAKLREANLVDADLSGARLDVADLRGADLRGARLSSTTDFTSAQVQGAKFTEGVLDLTSLSTAQKRDVIVVPP